MKPELAKGVRDWYGREAILRNKIVTTLRNVFESYGYPPLETPMLERLETIARKGGGEIQKEVFRLKDQGDRDLALRFDQTLPFARYIATNDVKLPFKRHAIGAVFRDGPTQPDQGRYRIFTQCDVDVAGVADMTAEAELFGLAQDAFHKLGLGGVDVRINNRKLLDGILDTVAVPTEARTPVIIALDKQDKIGLDGVEAELRDLRSKVIKVSEKAFKGAVQLHTGHRFFPPDETVKDLLRKDLGAEAYAVFEASAHNITSQSEFIQLLDSFSYTGNPLLSGDQVTALLELVKRKDSNQDTYKGLVERITSATGKEGLAEISTLLNYADHLGYDFVQFDPTLARGLDYYTGTTIEVYLKDKTKVKSAILAGGRFDNMVGDFCESPTPIPAVGFSFGLERLAMIIDSTKQTNTQVYLIPVGGVTEKALVVAKNMREQGLNVDMELRSGIKVGNSIKYAVAQGIPYVALIGQNELDSQTVALKELSSGTQRTVPLASVGSEITPYHGL